MRFRLYSLFFFSHYPLIFITIASSTNNNNSSINIDFYQCDTNTTTTLNGTTITIDEMILCNVSCCTSNSIYIKIISKISFHFVCLASSNICQVTVQSSTGICLGRLCYSGECDNFTLLANTTYDQKIKNKTTIMNLIHSSFSNILWSSWTDKTGLTIRHTILILLFITNISLTCLALIKVIKSIRHANMIAGDKTYRYTLL